MIQDDLDIGYMMYQTAEKAYITAYFMPTTATANITIFSFEVLKESPEELANYSQRFFMADSATLNFLQRKK